MKLISIIACSSAAAWLYANGIGNASATTVNCDSSRGEDVTVVDGHTACRAQGPGVLGFQQVSSISMGL
jgi:hypothetical protein